MTWRPGKALGISCHPASRRPWYTEAGLWGPGNQDEERSRAPKAAPASRPTGLQRGKVEVKLKFSSAYTGNVSLYAVDWDNLGRTEEIEVAGHPVDLEQLQQGRLDHRADQPSRR